jgi:hypothetical protein
MVYSRIFCVEREVQRTSFEIQILTFMVNILENTFHKLTLYPMEKCNSESNAVPHYLNGKIYKLKNHGYTESTKFPQRMTYKFVVISV